MKPINKCLLTFFVLGSLSLFDFGILHAAREISPNFQLMNKHPNSALYVTISCIKRGNPYYAPIISKAVTVLPAERGILETTVDTSRDVLIKLWETSGSLLAAGQREIGIYQIPTGKVKGKTIYLTWGQVGKNKYSLYPQTGRKNGLRGRTKHQNRSLWRNIPKKAIEVLEENCENPCFKIPVAKVEKPQELEAIL